MHQLAGYPQTKETTKNKQTNKKQNKTKQNKNKQTNKQTEKQNKNKETNKERKVIATGGDSMKHLFRGGKILKVTTLYSKIPFFLVLTSFL